MAETAKDTKKQLLLKLLQDHTTVKIENLVSSLNSTPDGIRAAIMDLRKSGGYNITTSDGMAVLNPGTAVIRSTKKHKKRVTAAPEAAADVQPSRASRVLDAIRSHPGISTKALGKATGMRTGAVYNTVYTLRKNGYTIQQPKKGHYTLGAEPSSEPVRVNKRAEKKVGKTLGDMGLRSLSDIPIDAIRNLVGADRKKFYEILREANFFTQAAWGMLNANGLVDELKTLVGDDTDIEGITA